MLCEWRGIHMQHRYEDLALIAEVIRTHRPDTIVELGTDQGGFTAFLLETSVAWRASVVTFDIVDKGGVDAAALAFAHEPDHRKPRSITFHVGDVLSTGSEASRALVKLLARPRTMLYCDNGNKEREISLYAQHMGPSALLGTHDYHDEVRPEWVEPYLAGFGFDKHRHDDFAALAHQEWYPRSLTRFWTRA